jgi:murein DD-endopeptidase MepM/ murein hydrolase activator NlpD
MYHTPLQFALQVCSPLAWETIPELFEIVSDPYKPPPPGRAEERHHGVDFSHYSRKGFSSIEGETVQAILPGVVAASIRDRLPYGNMVIIETAYSSLPTEFTRLIELGNNQALYVLYAHFRQAPEVDLGDTVDCGQKLGEVGAVGYNVVNAHLHMETRVGPGAVFASMALHNHRERGKWKITPAGVRKFLHFDPMVFFRTYLNFILNRP